MGRIWPFPVFSLHTIFTMVLVAYVLTPGFNKKDIAVSVYTLIDGHEISPHNTMSSCRKRYHCINQTRLMAHFTTISLRNLYILGKYNKLGANLMHTFPNDHIHKVQRFCIYSFYHRLHNHSHIYHQTDITQYLLVAWPDVRYQN